jgi:hypothetical protein
MERYQPKNKEEATYKVTGNLYLASSVQEAFSSRDFILEEWMEAVSKFPNRAQAIIELYENRARSVYAYIYVPHAKYEPVRNRVSLRDVITLNSGRVNYSLRIPPESFNSEERVDLELNGWESDIIVLASFYTDTNDETYTLSHFLRELRSNPRETLGARLLDDRRKIT